MKYVIEVYLDGLRDRTHESDGKYEEATKVADTVLHTIQQEAVSKLVIRKEGLTSMENRYGKCT